MNFVGQHFFFQTLTWMLVYSDISLIIVFFENPNPGSIFREVLAMDSSDGVSLKDNPASMFKFISFRISFRRLCVSS